MKCAKIIKIIRRIMHSIEPQWQIWADTFICRTSVFPSKKPYFKLVDINSRIKGLFIRTKLTIIKRFLVVVVIRIKFLGKRLNAIKLFIL